MIKRLSRESAQKCAAIGFVVFSSVAVLLIFPVVLVEESVRLVAAIASLVACALALTSLLTAALVSLLGGQRNEGTRDPK